MILCAPTYNLGSSPLEYLKNSYFSYCGVTFLIDEDFDNEGPIFSAIIDDQTTILGICEILGKYQLDDHHFFVSFANKDANILIRGDSFIKNGTSHEGNSGFVQFYHHDNAISIALPSIDDIEIDINAINLGRTDIKYTLFHPEDLSFMSISLDENSYHLEDSQWVSVSDIPNLSYRPNCLH